MNKIHMEIADYGAMLTLIKSSFAPVTSTALPRPPFPEDSLTWVMIEDSMMPLCAGQEAVRSNVAEKRYCRTLGDDRRSRRGKQLTCT